MVYTSFDIIQSETEVIVTGAGIWGVFNALQISKRGLHVVLVDNIHQKWSYNVQYLTDTDKSSAQYVIVGDAASIIDAYYSQRSSLSLTTLFRRLWR